MPTPCGTNCSYVMEFEGPYMECNISTSAFTSNTTDSPFNIFTGQWTASPNQSPNPALFYNGTYTLAHFVGSVLTPLNVTGTYNGGGINETALIQNDTSICAPGRARYTVENRYLNGVQSRNISTKPVDKLINLALPTHNSVVIVPGFCAGSGIDLGYGTVRANWTNSSLAFYRDNNMMAIFSSLMSWLDGEFEAGVEANFSSSINGTQTSYVPYWKEGVYVQSDGNSVATSLGGNLLFAGCFWTHVLMVY